MTRLTGPVLSISLAGLVLAALVPGATLGADSKCRVRNVTQDTTGRSLILMVERAVDGDSLRVRGMCPGEIVISRDITVLGADDRATLTGRQRSRVVRVRAGARVTLQGLRIQGGLKRGGAGIMNHGRLTLVDVLIRRNVAPELFEGGAIFNRNRLIVEDSVIVGNHASSGAGIATVGGRVTLLRTHVVENVASFEVGGGIAIRDSVVDITDSTVRGNSARLGGGGIWNLYGDLAIANSRVRRNRSDPQIGYGAGALMNWEGTVEVVDTVIADNASVSGAGITNVRGEVMVASSRIARNEAGGDGGGITNRGGSLGLTGTTVTANTADAGGGIWNGDSQGSNGTVTLDATSSVSGNTPDDCVGTPAC